MLKHIESIVLFVPDIGSAAAWYAQIFNAEVQWENPAFAFIKTNSVVIGFHPADSKCPGGVGGTTAYWEVENINESIEFLTKRGAKLHRGPGLTSFGAGAAMLIDPFGCTIGLNASSPESRARLGALGEQHVLAYRELMLEAYEFAADAFTTTVEERRAEPVSWWVKRIASPSGLSQAYGAWDKETLVGSVALEFSAKPKTRHCALVLGMYVRPAYRGRGIGMALLQAAAQAAAERPGIRVLTLTLTEGNEPAMRLYRAAGFAVWGVEPLAISTGAGYKGKVHMSKLLHPAGTAA